MPEELKSNFDLPTISARHFVSFYQQPHYPVDDRLRLPRRRFEPRRIGGGRCCPRTRRVDHQGLNARGLPIDQMIADGRFACADVGETLGLFAGLEDLERDKL